MKAITLWQPWASLIVYGFKTYETRSWSTDYRGWLAIHASKKQPAHVGWMLNVKDPAHESALFWECLEACGYYEFKDMPRGVVLGHVQLVNVLQVEDVDVRYVDSTDRGNRRADDKAIICHRDLVFGDWTPGRFAWELRDPVIFNTPVPSRGSQKLWEWGNHEGV